MGMFRTGVWAHCLKEKPKMEVWGFLICKEVLEIDSESSETHETTLNLKKKNRLTLDGTR